MYILPNDDDDDGPRTKSDTIIIIKQLMKQYKEYDKDKNHTMTNDNNYNNNKSITPFSLPIAIPVQEINQYNN